MATELFDDHAYRAVPLTDVDAAELISAPRAEPLPNGYWGAGVVARGPLIDLTSRPSTLADDLPEVSDLQLRPVLADAPCQETAPGRVVGTEPAPLSGRWHPPHPKEAGALNIGLVLSESGST